MNSQLSRVLTFSDLSGPLFDKNITEPTNLMKNESIYIVVRTPYENGEIQELIDPSSSGK